MKKIALLLVVALVVQLMPVNVGTVWAADDTPLSTISDTVYTIASDKYYQVLDTNGNSYYPFIMESSNLESNRTYTLKSVTVDGIDMTDKFRLKSSLRSATPDDYSRDCPYVYVEATDGDFLEVSKEHTIKAVITDEYDETFTLETTCIMEPFQDTYEIAVEKPEYISTTGVMKTGIKLAEKSFFTKDASTKASKVELADQNGKVYGTLNCDYSYPPYGLYDYRYDNTEIRSNCENLLWTMVGSYENVCQTLFMTYSNMYIRQELAEGFYDVIYTLSDGTKYIYKKAYEAVTRPIIYNISDADSAVEYGHSVLTDQTGDYVSVYVYGWNITKDTVKPVFYNENDEVISGDVAAVETDNWGGFFRIEKNDPDSEDWDIQLSTYESGQQKGSKAFDVKVETKEEVFEKNVNIIRRDIFYQYFDQRDNSFTVYYGTDADIDMNSSPKLSFVKWDYNVYKYIPFETVEGGTFTQEVNELTGQKETKAKFILTDDQIATIENEYEYYYSVEYKNSAGEVKSHLSEYLAKNAQGGCNFEDVSEKGIFSGYGTNILYLPYWIGGVHSIAPNGEEFYYLTEEDMAILSDGKYSFAYYRNEDVSKDETDFVRNVYYFMKVGTPPVKPAGKPVLSVEKIEDSYKFNWTEVAGANKYSLYLKYGEAEIPFSQRNDNYFEIEAEILPILFMEYFEECRANADESKMEIFVKPMNQEDGATAYGDKSNVLTVAGIKNSDNTGNSSGGSQTHTHTTETQITKAKVGTNGAEKVVCTICKEVIKTTTIYAPKTVTVTDLVYNGKNQTPKVVVKDSQGKVIDKANYSVSKVKNVGDNNITVTFATSSKYYTGTITSKAKVNPKGTTLAKLTAKKKSIVVKWKKQTAQTKGYQIQYSTNKNFKSNVKSITIKKNKTTSYTIKKLKAKKKYYVRIRTYKGKCYSAWSKKKSVKTK